MFHVSVRGDSEKYYSNLFVFGTQSNLYSEHIKTFPHYGVPLSPAPASLSFSKAAIIID